MYTAQIVEQYKFDKLGSHHNVQNTERSAVVGTMRAERSTDCLSNSVTLISHSY